MLRAFILLVSLCFASNAVAITSEQKFQECVQIKELTLAIARGADKGISRAEMKKIAINKNMPASFDLIDLVYDFHGALSNDVMAARQMETCLKQQGLVGKNGKVRK